MSFPNYSSYFVQQLIKDNITLHCFSHLPGTRCRELLWSPPAFFDSHFASYEENHFIRTLQHRLAPLQDQASFPGRKLSWTFANRYVFTVITVRWALGGELGKPLGDGLIGRVRWWKPGQQKSQDSPRRGKSPEQLLLVLPSFSCFILTPLPKKTVSSFSYPH